MRFTRSIFLLIALAVLSASYMSSSASAQGVEIGLVNGSHCGSATLTPPHQSGGGCEITVTNSSSHIILYRHTGTGEVVAVACDNSYRMNIGENGEGYVNQFRSTNTGGGESLGCGQTVTPCDIEGESGHHEPWPIHFAETSPNQVHAVTRLCIDVLVSAFPVLSCEIEGNIEQGLTRNPEGNVSGAEAEGDGTGVPITSRVVVAHGPPHATCEGIGGQAEIGGHWSFSPFLTVSHI